MSFTREKCTEISADIARAIGEVEKKHGIQLMKRSGSFSDNEYSLKLSFIISDLSARNYERESKMLGFEEDIVGKTFTNRGRSFTITQIDLKKYQFPVIAVGDDNRQYKFSVKDATILLKMKLRPGFEYMMR